LSLSGHETLDAFGRQMDSVGRLRGRLNAAARSETHANKVDDDVGTGVIRKRVAS